MAGIPFWFASLLLLVFGVLCGVRGMYEARIRRQLHQEGIDTEAIVVGHEARGGSRSPTTYYVKYRYHSQGQSYEREESVSSSRYNAYPRGMHIPVCYLPQNPTVVRVAGMKNHSLSLGLMLVALALITAVLAFLLT